MVQENVLDFRIWEKNNFKLVKKEKRNDIKLESTMEQWEVTTKRIRTLIVTDKGQT